MKIFTYHVFCALFFELERCQQLCSETFNNKKSISYLKLSVWEDFIESVKTHYH